jgi:hypothetical protein
MDPVVGTMLVEGAKLALQVYFTNMKLANKTEEEIDLLFQEELYQFNENKPEDLPDV